MVMLKARSMFNKLGMLESLLDQILWSTYTSFSPNSQASLVRKPSFGKASNMSSGFRICGVCGMILLALLIFMFTLFYLDVVHLVSAPAYSSGILLNAAGIRSLARLNADFVYDENPHVSTMPSQADLVGNYSQIDQKYSNASQTQDAEDLEISNSGSNLAGNWTSTPHQLDNNATDDHLQDVGESQHNMAIEEVTKPERAGSSEGGQEECSLYEGRWVQDDTYPLYDAEACPFIDPGFRCQENGRPDQEYLRWRWQPLGCDLPRFKPEELLEMLRGKRVVFVGDSIGRNQWESMLCMLAGGVENKSRVYEASGQAISKHTGFLSFVFEDFNLRVEYYRSPFLVPQARPPAGSHPNVTSTLLLDFMDWSSKHWLPADILIFNTGHWWSFEKIMRGGCYFRVGDHANITMDVHEGFRRAMQTWRNWVAKEVNLTQTRVFFRTYAPVHFSNGTWKTGGQCHEERQPWPEGTRLELEQYWTNEHVMRAVASLQDKDDPTAPTSVKLLNITGLSSYRKDAHSSIYNVGKQEVRPMHRQDCSHWCLPGLPDVWNQLLFASL